MSSSAITKTSKIFVQKNETSETGESLPQCSGTYLNAALINTAITNTTPERVRAKPHPSVWEDRKNAKKAHRKPNSLLRPRDLTPALELQSNKTCLESDADILSQQVGSKSTNPRKEFFTFKQTDDKFGTVKILDPEIKELFARFMRRQIIRGNTKDIQTCLKMRLTICKVIKATYLQVNKDTSKTSSHVRLQIDDNDNITWTIGDDNSEVVEEILKTKEGVFVGGDFTGLITIDVSSKSYGAILGAAKKFECFAVKDPKTKRPMVFPGENGEFAILIRGFCRDRPVFKLPNQIRGVDLVENDKIRTAICLTIRAFMCKDGQGPMGYTPFHASEGSGEFLQFDWDSYPHKGDE